LVNNYINLNNTEIYSYIFDKYGLINNDVCVCIRNAYDHPGRSFNKEYYMKSINYLQSIGRKIDNIYILSDTNDLWLEEDGYNLVQIKECDIIQFYFGLLCNNMILSCSTFHLWIAYFNPKACIIHGKTDLFTPEYNLKLDTWIDINKI